MKCLDHSGSVEIKPFGRRVSENVRKRSSKWSRHAFNVGDAFFAEVVETSGCPSSEVGVAKLSFGDSDVVRDSSETEVGVCAQDLVDQPVTL